VPVDDGGFADGSGVTAPIADVNGEAVADDGGEAPVAGSGREAVLAVDGRDDDRDEAALTANGPIGVPLERILEACWLQVSCLQACWLQVFWRWLCLPPQSVPTWPVCSTAALRAVGRCTDAREAVSLASGKLLGTRTSMPPSEPSAMPPCELRRSVGTAPSTAQREPR